MASRSDIKAGSAFVELTLKNDSFLKGIRASSQQLQNFGKSIASIGAMMSAAGGAILAPMIAGLSKFISKGEGLYEMSKRTGITAKGLAELGYAAKQSGTDMEQIEGGVHRMQKLLGDAANGSAEARTELARLGLTLGELQGQSPDEQFEKIGAKIAAIPDPTMRAAEAMAIFGKSGAELLPLFENLSLVAEARALGIGPTAEELRLAHELSGGLRKVSGAWDSVGTSLGAAIAPMVSGAIPAIVKIVQSAKTWIKTNADLIQRIAGVGAVLVATGAAIASAGGAIMLLGFGLSKLLTVFAPVKALFGLVVTIGGALLTPMGLLTIGIGAATAAFFAFTDAGANLMNGLRLVGSFFSETFDGIRNAISAGNLGLAGSIAINALQVSMLEGVAGLSKAVGGELGNFIGDVGAKLLTGNLKGAWIDVCSGLRTVWFDLCTGMLTVFENFIKRVKAAWAPISKEIATSLQKAFESTGGTLYSKPMQSIPQLELNQRLLQAHTAENSQGWFSGGGLSEESRRKLGIAQWHREEQDAEMQRALKEDPLGGTIHEDMIEFHRKRAQQLLDSIRDDVDKALQAADRVSGGAPRVEAANLVQQSIDQFQKDVTAMKAEAAAEAQKAANEFKKNIAGGKDRASDALDEAKRHRQELLDQAAREREQKNARDRSEIEDAAGAGDRPRDIQKHVAGAFGAEQSKLLGGYGGVSLGDKIDETNKNLKAQTGVMQQAGDDIAAMRAALGTGPN